MSYSSAIVNNTEFFNSNHFSGFVRVDNSNLKMEKCNIHKIVSEGTGFIESMDFGSKASLLSFKDCKFKDNEFFKLTSIETENIVFDNCIFEANKGDMGNYNIEETPN